MEWSRGVFSGFLEALPDAAIVIEDSGRIVLGNARAGDLFRLPPGDLGERTLASLLSGESSGAEAALRSLAEPAPGHAGDAWTFARSDGHPFAAQVAHSRIALDGQNLILVVLRDVSDQKRAEDEVRTSEERLRQAVRVSEIGFFVHDHATDTHYWSARQHEMYGWPTDEPVTVPAFLRRLHPDDRGAIEAGIRRAHDPAGDGAFDVEHRIIRSDGEVRWISTRSVTLFDGEGAARRAVRTVGASLDFTDRKRSEEGRERLAAILDATPDFVSTADPSCQILYLNRAARALFGVERDEDVGRRRVGDGCAPWARELVRGTAVPAAIHEGVWTGESAFLDRDGREVPVSQVILAHRTSDGAVAFLSTIARDLTKEKSLEAQLLHAQKMEAIGRLAGGVAHDFNNLLSVILGSAALAARRLPPGHPSRTDIDEITRAGERAAELTRGMLAFSRKQVLLPRVLDVNAVLEGMMPMLARLIGEHIELRALLSPELGRTKVDANQLEQVILNLVVNARDAMARGGTLTLATRNASFDDRSGPAPVETLRGEYVRISVADTGVGMDPVTQSRIFEPFFTTKGPGQGTGLGLSMVFGVVKQSGGEIAVHSEPGRGTTMSIYLPRTEEAGVKVTPERAREAAVAGSGLVLLVEDEAQLRTLTARILRNEGYEVLVAEGPIEALALERREARAIDLLLTDVVMPRMSGTELADQIAARRPKTRVLLMSGYTENDVVGLAGKGAHFLAKPFSPADLLAAVHRVLDVGAMPNAS